MRSVRGVDAEQGFGVDVDNDVEQPDSATATAAVVWEGASTPVVAVGKRK